MKLLVLLCCFVLNSPFVDSCHTFENIGKHPYALWATNIWHPRSFELSVQMRNDHHQLPHAFCVALWVFLSPQGNALELGLDLHNIIFSVPKNGKKLSRLTFSFAHNSMNQKISGSEVFKNFL